MSFRNAARFLTVLGGLGVVSAQSTSSKDADPSFKDIVFSDFKIDPDETRSLGIDVGDCTFRGIAQNHRVQIARIRFRRLTLIPTALRILPMKPGA